MPRKSHRQKINSMITKCTQILAIGAALKDALDAENRPDISADIDVSLTGVVLVKEWLEKIRTKF